MISVYSDNVYIYDGFQATHALKHNKKKHNVNRSIEQVYNSFKYWIKLIWEVAVVAIYVKLFGPKLFHG